MDTREYTPQMLCLNEQTTDRIVELCKIVLVNEDALDFENAKKYIEEHISNNIIFQGDRHSIRHIVQEEVKQYIENCPLEIQIFIFDSDSGLQKYRKKFKNYYNKFYYETTGEIDALTYPVEFEDVFNCIQESIDSYTLYKSFSIKLENSIQERVEKKADNTVRNIATECAEQIVKDAIDAEKMEDKITEKVTKEIDKQMNNVSKNISETSVTILGIFSGIVLTVVAGLFYSSSVLENVNAANFFRLMSVSALVGFVCFNLIAIMFKFIEGIRLDSKQKESFSDRKMLFVNIALLVIMLLSTILNFVFPDYNTKNQNKSDINVSAELNLSTQEIETTNKPIETTVPQVTNAENITKETQTTSKNKQN